MFFPTLPKKVLGYSVSTIVVDVEGCSRYFGFGLSRETCCDTVGKVRESQL